MDKGLIYNIINYFINQPCKVLLVENKDGFLYREDVIKLLDESNIRISIGSSIKHRVEYELRDENCILVLLNDDNSNFLEDIKLSSTSINFYLKDYISSFYIPTVVKESIEILEILYYKNPLVTLTKSQTAQELSIIKSFHEDSIVPTFDILNFNKKIDLQLKEPVIDWSAISKNISDALIATIGTEDYNNVMSKINNVNEVFQIKLERDFHASKNSSAAKKPQIVSKVLDYLNFNFKKEKVALIVIDGLGYWQYQLLKDKLPNPSKEDVIYSWIPSITQLSRQAVFRGSSPLKDYKQGPLNEARLWSNYWKSNGFNKSEIRYNHQKIDLENLNNIKRFALVFKDLDDYMHNSKNYHDLFKLTENWIDRSNINEVVVTLLKQNFKIFLTTDHGNIQAKGWRNLNGKEKLGTSNSGSRSQRHLEYSEQWLSDEFMNANPTIKESVVMEDEAFYFKNDLSFSNEEVLVTHGGAHFLEVLIPFIEFSND